MKTTLSIKGNLDVTLKASVEKNDVDFNFHKEGFELMYNYEAEEKEVAAVMTGLKEIATDCLGTVMSMVTATATPIVPDVHVGVMVPTESFNEVEKKTEDPKEEEHTATKKTEKKDK